MFKVAIVSINKIGFITKNPLLSYFCRLKFAILRIYNIYLKSEKKIIVVKHGRWKDLGNRAIKTIGVNNTIKY